MAFIPLIWRFLSALETQNAAKNYNFLVIILKDHENSISPNEIEYQFFRFNL